MWNDFFGLYGVKDGLLDKAYAMTNDLQKAWFKQQIADLTSIYGFFRPILKTCTNVFDTFELGLKQKNKTKAVCIIDVDFWATNQILAVILPLLVSQVDVGVIFLSRLLFKKRYFVLTGLDLAGVLNIACAPLKDVQSFLNQEVDLGAIFWFGFFRRKRFNIDAWRILTWMVPTRQKAIISSKGVSLDLKQIKLAHPHVIFSTDSCEQNQDIFWLALGEDVVAEEIDIDLTLGVGKESSWLWPGIEKFIPCREYLCKTSKCLG